MRVLIACELSGIGRRAFQEVSDREGYNLEVVSCDLLPADDGHPSHIVADVRDVLKLDWDMVIGHPPCTRLCRSGRNWMSGPGKWTPPTRLPKGQTLEGIRMDFRLGVELFKNVWHAKAKYVAVENPVMNDLALAEMPADLVKPQVVQPFWFGDPEYKATGWYLKNLPRLKPTNVLPEPARLSDEWKRWNKVHRLPPSPQRAKLRSQSYRGMMLAAAEQWLGHMVREEMK